MVSSAFRVEKATTEKTEGSGEEVPTPTTTPRDLWAEASVLAIFVSRDSVAFREPVRKARILRVRRDRNRPRCEEFKRMPPEMMARHRAFSIQPVIP